MRETTIGEWMTPNPVTIPSDLSLSDAIERMFEHDIRHLPVTDQGHIVGLVSERDLALVMSIPGVDKDAVDVCEAMRPHPFIVSSDTPLDEVVAVMREKKIGTAVVMDDGKLTGIFSTIDALAVLSTALRGDAAKQTG